MARGWTALDAGPDGSLLAVSVRRRARARPQVVKCACSPAGPPTAQALAQLADKVSVVGFPWTMTLQRGDYQLLVIAEPAVQASEMESSLRWTLSSMIDFPVDEANLAWMKIPTAEQQPNHARHIYAIVSQKSIAEARLALFQQAKLKLRALDVRETAQRNIAALLEKKNEGLGLVCVGAAGVLITFSFGGELYLDRFIEQPLDDMLAADAARQASIFDQIALQLSRSVDFVSRNFPFMTVQRIVLAPLPAALGLRDYLAHNLALPVQALNLADVFDLALTPELEAAENQARYFVALGAALRGMGKMG